MQSHTILVTGSSGTPSHLEATVGVHWANPHLGQSPEDVVPIRGLPIVPSVCEKRCIPLRSQRDTSSTWQPALPAGGTFSKLVRLK